IFNNPARDRGGVLFISYLPVTQVDIFIVNTTNTGNDSNGRGGGGIKSEGDLLLIVGTTITNNSARFGGAMLSRGQAPTIQNSILSGNFGTVASDNLDGDFANPESNYNLLGSGDAIGGSNDITAIDDPLLGPLADNGGPTLTHALLPGSPAIDAGDPTIQFDPNEFDQRGAPFLRVADGNFPNDIAIDIGAYEAQSIPLADFDTDFDVDGADFLAWQRGFGNANAVRADGNSDDDSDVDASDLAAWSVSYGEPSVASSQSSALSANVAAAWQRLSFDPGDQSDFVEDGQAFVAAEALVNADGVRPLADSKPRSLDSTRVTARDLAMESLLPFEDESLGDAFR
ncbi:MAG: choice-of-anchor Q domain-containing protein, partial [Planctomycetota bacterium]